MTKPFQLLLDDDFNEYKVIYRNENSGKTTWRCNSTQFPNCHGCVWTMGLVKPIHVKKIHEYEPDAIQVLTKNVVSDMKEVSEKQPDTKPRKIIFEGSKNLLPEVVAQMPSYALRCTNALRQRMLRVRVDPYDEYEIPVDLFDKYVVAYSILILINNYL